MGFLACVAWGEMSVSGEFCACVTTRPPRLNRVQGTLQDLWERILILRIVRVRFFLTFLVAGDWFRMSNFGSILICHPLAIPRVPVSRSISLEAVRLRGAPTEFQHIIPMVFDAWLPCTRFRKHILTSLVMSSS